MNKVKKQQHIIPEKSYLQYWEDTNERKPSLWVYRIKEDHTVEGFSSITPIGIPADQFAKEHFFYESSEKPQNALETALQQIEDEYNPILREKITKGKELTKEDKIKVTRFISSMELRTKSARENVEDFQKRSLDMITMVEKAHELKGKSSVHKQIEESLKGNIMFTDQLVIGTNFNRYSIFNIQFFVIDEDSKHLFLTCNHPVAMLDLSYGNSFYTGAPLSPTIEITIPLTPYITAFLSHGEFNTYEDVTYDFNYINEVNSRVLLYSHDYFISKRKLEEDEIKRMIERDRQSLLLRAMRDNIYKD